MDVRRPLIHAVERYVFLLAATPQAAQFFLRSASAAFAAQKGILADLGAVVIDHYAVVGPYDIIAIIDCHDNASCLAASLLFTMAGLSSTPIRVLREPDIDLAASRMASVQARWTPAAPLDGNVPSGVSEKTGRKPRPARRAKKKVVVSR